jgi:hypothetical protein
MDIQSVISLWVRGIPAKSGNVRTDGFTLWSYSTIIGLPDGEGGRVAIRPPRRSVTTSKHVNWAAKAAGKVRDE